MENKLVEILEKRGKNGFIVVPSPEAPMIDYATLKRTATNPAMPANHSLNEFIPQDFSEAQMLVDREPTPYEQVAYSSVAKVIAKRLARTQLADPYGPGSIEDSWSDSGVIDATLGVMSSLDKAGYTIVPKPEQEIER